MPDEDRSELPRWTRAPSLPAGLVQRARIVLLADEGVGTNEIAQRVGVSKPTVIAWKKRYAAEGIGGLEDRAKSGRPPVIDPVEIVLATLAPPPESLGVAHWSSRLLAKHLGVSDYTVTTTWKKWALQPWRVQTFTFSPTPNWKPRSATSSGCICTRRIRRSCCVWTRSPRCRRWIAPRRCCR